MPDCLPKWLYPFTLLSAMNGSSCCSTFMSAFGAVSVLGFHHSNRYVTVYSCFLFFFYFSIQFWELPLQCGREAWDPVTRSNWDQRRGADCDVGWRWSSRQSWSRRYPWACWVFPKTQSRAQGTKGKVNSKWWENWKKLWILYKCTHSLSLVKQCVTLLSVKPDVHISLELVFAKHASALHSFIVASPVVLCSPGSQTMSSRTLEVDFINRHLSWTLAIPFQSPGVIRLRN